MSLPKYHPFPSVPELIILRYIHNPVKYLSDDIIKFPPNLWPTARDLQVKYGSDISMMRKHLGSLEAKGLIKRIPARPWRFYPTGRGIDTLNTAEEWWNPKLALRYNRLLRL
mgnify:FL=1